MIERAERFRQQLKDKFRNIYHLKEDDVMYFKRIFREFISESPDNLLMLDSINFTVKQNKTIITVNQSSEFNSILNKLVSVVDIGYKIKSQISDFTNTDWEYSLHFLMHMFDSLESIINYIYIEKSENTHYPIFLLTDYQHKHIIVYDKFYDPIEKRNRKGIKLYHKKYSLVDVAIALENIKNPIDNLISSNDWDVFTRFLVVSLIACE